MGLRGLDVKIEVIEDILLPQKPALTPDANDIEPDVEANVIVDGSSSIKQEVTLPEDCPICLAPLVGECATTLCGHRFHTVCLERHILTNGIRHVKCPMCRSSMRAPMKVEAKSTSGRPIEVMEQIPHAGEVCHFDRNYRFISLGDFTDRPSLLYLMTSNEDKRTPATTVMWTLEASVPVTVYLNFRSSRHASKTGLMSWLNADGWTQQPTMRSTVSTGIPNGPYSGPVYSKACEPGRIDLMGANCQEGTYFVFIELS